MTFSPAVTKRGEMIAVSGLNALDCEGRVQYEGDVVGQARVIYDNLADILDHAGAGPGDVVKTTDYILSRDSYAGTAAVRVEFFGDHRPAATGW